MGFRRIFAAVCGGFRTSLMGWAQLVTAASTPRSRRKTTGADMTNPETLQTQGDEVSGPGAGGARKARRLAVVGAAALLIAAGGATAAYASGAGDVETGYATFVTSTDGTQPEPEAPVQVGPGAPDGAQTSTPDCPEKQGGTGEQEGPDSSNPESQAAPQAPDTSTL
jgi:hypothetical protein